MEEGGHPSEKHMDDFFKSIGLQRKKIAKDGSCLFRAVAEQVGDHIELAGVFIRQHMNTILSVVIIDCTTRHSDNIQTSYH